VRVRLSVGFDATKRLLEFGLDGRRVSIEVCCGDDAIAEYVN
jgi:hypothetical protein